ncbi:competence type IV pilus major pilin ComGC [Alkalithermobacter paradoxus]|uniref:Putative major pilin subunit n=1 Tax=Alkalithermobacter paradoxus TaxID=29349 RepID=A0A1V4I8M0_9FIRM|nr:putative major pilin subunit [[Clostridium] thermoalcaliphilum]
MIKAVRKVMNSKKGFTLVELIVVLAVLGIIAGIAIPRFGNIQEESKRKADIATGAVIGKAAELALANGETDVAVDKLVSKGYLESLPKPQYKADKDFVVTVTGGNVTVTVDNQQVYPDGKNYKKD